MKILFYGAGVLGSLYAARLKETGHDVTVLARGQRLRELREHGILYQRADSGLLQNTRVNLVERLDPQDAYDLVVVLVRHQQLASVLPALAANRNTPNLLFMVNNPGGAHEILRQVARERVLLGFAGAGGVRAGEVVRYSLAPAVFQPTTFGELTGLRTPRLERILYAFQAAGFHVNVCPDMDAWLKTHAAWVIPTAGAIYLAGGSIRRLAHTRDGLVLLVRAVRENFAILAGLGVPVTPARMRLWQVLPEPLLVQLLARLFNTRLAETAIEQHANAARADEMPALASEFRALARRSGLASPSAALLGTYLTAARTPLPSGSSSLTLDWRGTLITAWVLLVVVRLFGFFRSQRKP